MLVRYETFYEPADYRCAVRANGADAFGSTVVPARKVPSISANNARSNRQPQRLRDLDSITAQREHLMTELARLRANCGSDKVIDSVQQLLTRWWSPASWHARKELLKTAEWFLRLERTGSD